jgi:hypothetical protein
MEQPRIPGSEIEKYVRTETGSDGAEEQTRGAIYQLQHPRSHNQENVALGLNDLLDIAKSEAHRALQLYVTGTRVVMSYADARARVFDEAHVNVLAPFPLVLLVGPCPPAAGLAAPGPLRLDKSLLRRVDRTRARPTLGSGFNPVDPSWPLWRFSSCPPPICVIQPIASK